MSQGQEFWRRCSSCKNPIDYLEDYYVCSVSSCNRKRDGMVFCSLPCFDRHSPVMGHRDPWAEPMTAPSPQEARSPVRRRVADPRRDRPSLPSGVPARERRLVGAQGSSASRDEIPPLVLNTGAGVPEDVLIVVSKLKAYIQARSGMKTSASVNDVLSDIVRIACDTAVETAHQDGRKTVMGRDFSASVQSIARDRHSG